MDPSEFEVDDRLYVIKYKEIKTINTCDYAISSSMLSAVPSSSSSTSANARSLVASLYLKLSMFKIDIDVCDIYV